MNNGVKVKDWSAGLAGLKPRICSASSESRRFSDVCLVDSFRAIGLKVPYSQDGPFWAVQDGNGMLEPLGCLGWTTMRGTLSQ